MSIKQSFISLQEYRKDLSSLLDSHVVNLAESFSKESLLSQSEVAAIRKPDQQKTKADCFLDIIINKVKNDSDDCFDKLVAYMKNSKDPTLLNLANKMSPNQQNIDNSQYRQPVQTESAPSSPPTLMEYEKCHYQRKNLICTYLHIYVCVCTIHNAQGFIYMYANTQLHWLAYACFQRLLSFQNPRFVSLHVCLPVIPLQAIHVK